MEAEQIRAVMVQINKELCAEFHGKSLRPHRKGKRFTPWDINNGLCEEWAVQVMERIPDIVEVWETDFDLVDCGNHFFVKIRGLFYDAEALDGVKDYMDIPLFARYVKASGNDRRQPVMRSMHNIPEEQWKTYPFGRSKLGDHAERHRLAGIVE